MYSRYVWFPCCMKLQLVDLIQSAVYYLKLFLGQPWDSPGRPPGTFPWERPLQLRCKRAIYPRCAHRGCANQGSAGFLQDLGHAWDSGVFCWQPSMYVRVASPTDSYAINRRACTVAAHHNANTRVCAQLELTDVRVLKYI